MAKKPGRKPLPKKAMKATKAGMSVPPLIVKPPTGGPIGTPLKQGSFFIPPICN